MDISSHPTPTLVRSKTNLYLCGACNSSESSDILFIINFKTLQTYGKR